MPCSTWSTSTATARAAWSGNEADGIFDSRQQLFQGEMAPTSMLVTTFTYQPEAFPAFNPPVDATLTVRGAGYIVRDRQPDNLGAVTLILEKRP